jgi:hypothetical protein
MIFMTNSPNRTGLAFWGLWEIKQINGNIEANGSLYAQLLCNMADVRTILGLL